MNALQNVWYQRGARSDAGWWRVAAYESNEHGDGDTIATRSDGELPDGWLWRVDESDHGILRVHLAPTAGADAPL